MRGLGDGARELGEHTGGELWAEEWGREGERMRGNPGEREGESLEEPMHVGFGSKRLKANQRAGIWTGSHGGSCAQVRSCNPHVGLVSFGSSGTLNSA